MLTGINFLLPSHLILSIFVIVNPDDYNDLLTIIINFFTMKMNCLRFGLLLLPTLFLTAFTSFAQVSEGGLPPSFSLQGLSSQVDRLVYPAPDMEILMAEDEQNLRSAFPGPERMAYSVPVNLDVRNAGTVEILADGSILRRMAVYIPGALALGVYYSDFHLPDGAKLFLYNEAQTQVIGAFTDANNHESRLFANEFIQGDLVNIEYLEPAGTSGDVSVIISEIAYAYRYIDFVENGNRDQSWSCMINVKCPEGNGWENQIQGVARLSIKIGWSYYWCSGSLINNTNNDRTPYLLTAEHCGDGANASDRNQWVFYFNYQSATCTGNYGPSSNTMTGCTLKANDPNDNEYLGADFELVKLNGTPPSGYNVYYNGWNRTNNAADSGVCLHHPAGDIKKVSTYQNMVSSTWWNGTPSHWKVTWIETESGLSIMQGGSSGSSVFDENGLIMGDLSGGYSSNSCTNPSPAWFGKIWYAWDQNGDVPAERLKDWLDPTNTGVYTHPGLSSQILPPVVDFEADTTYLLQGESVHFTDLTTGNPALSWEWSFPGGTPNASDIQNPTITYNQAGTFDVTLTVTNADGEETELKPGYITVEQVLLPDADFVASALEVTEGDMIDFTDLSTNNPTAWDWIFNGGDPATSGEQNPDSVIYAVPGVYNVYLTASNNGGSNTELKENYITVLAGAPPVSDFYADKTEILPGDTVNFFDLSTGNPTQWTWTFEGAATGTSSVQNPENIVYPTEGTFYVRLRTKNFFGNNTIQKDGYITVGNISVGEINRQQGVMAFPNPTAGLLTVKLPEGAEAWTGRPVQGGNIQSSVNIEIVNSLGNVIRKAEFHADYQGVTFDLTDEPSGLYFVRVSTPTRSVQKKISLLR